MAEQYTIVEHDDGYALVIEDPYDFEVSDPVTFTSSTADGVVKKLVRALEQVQ